MALAPTPSVTFLLLCYNQERYVGDAVRAALAQDHRPLKILISDDCSSDRTFSVIRNTVADYQGPHEVRVVQTPGNLGLMAHLRKCVEAIDTEWIVAAAGDDVSIPSRASTIMRAVSRRPGIDAVTSSVKTIDANGTPDRLGVGSMLEFLIPASSLPRPSQRGRTIGYLVSHLGMIIGAAEAWKRSIWTDFPWPQSACTEDVVAGFRAAMRGGTISLRQRLVQYRRHESNMWSVAGINVPRRGSELHQRRRLLLLGSIEQHEVDLRFAVSQGTVPKELADELETLLWVKRGVADIPETVDGGAARSVAGLLSRVASDIRGRAPTDSWLPNRLSGWKSRCHREISHWIINRHLRL